MINISNIIKKHCKQNDVPLYKLASMLNLSHVALYSTLNKNDMRLSRLNQISKVLNHNFFQYFTDQTANSAPQNKKLLEENKQLSTRNAHLSKENNYLNEIIILLKERNK